MRLAPSPSEAPPAARARLAARDHRARWPAREPGSSAASHPPRPPRRVLRRPATGPVVLLIHGITSSADAWRAVMPGARRAPHGDRAGPARPRRARRSRAATTRSAPTPAACATCWPRSATSARRSSGTRSAAASRCSSPTSSPSASSASCSSPAAASAARSTSMLRAATLPGAELGAAAAPRRGRRDGAGRGARAARAARPPHRAPTSRGMRARARLAQRPARPAARSSTPRARSSTPAGQRVSATDRLYLAEDMPTLIVWGERDPMIPAAHGHAAHALIPAQPPRDLRRTRATSRSTTTRSASPRC